MAITPKHLIPLLFLPAAVFAQSQQPSDSTIPQSKIHAPPQHYWRNMAAGFATSIFSHEAGHILMAYAVGAHPSFGFDKGRPTVYSGIDATRNTYKQFLFSSAGLNVQALMDEAILDLPHHKGSAFERGILTGGIATAVFYATLGRNASNSDITFMARTSSLSKTQASLIYVGIAALHTFRIARDKHYAHFFMRPDPVTNGVRVGIAIQSAEQ
jgi:hypothetical protein